MVNAINTTNVINQSTNTTKQEDVRKLIKYVNNETLTQAPDTFTSNLKSGSKFAAVFEGIPFFNLLKRNKKLNGKFINENMKSLGNANKNALKELISGEGKLSERIFNYISSANESKRTYCDIKSAVKAEAKSQKLSGKAAKAADKAAKSGSASAQRAAEKAGKKAARAAQNAAERTAATTVEKAASTGVKATGKLGKLGKFMKSSGASFMLIFSGITEVATEVVPTFKELGKEKGLKQLGKSAIRVVGDTAGFIAGEQIGTAVGTAIGTAICPGIGTAIGSVVGFLGGMLGSWATGKVTKKITGSTEREIAKEEEAQKTAQEVFNDKSQTEELKNAAILKLQAEAELNNGELTADGKAALEALQNLV